MRLTAGRRPLDGAIARLLAVAPPPAWPRTRGRFRLVIVVATAFVAYLAAVVLGPSMGALAAGLATVAAVVLLTAEPRATRPDGALPGIPAKPREQDDHHQTAETLRALIEASPLAIMVMDLDGLVQLWNPAAERLTGWTEGEVLGQPPPIVPEEEPEALDQQRGDRIARGETVLGIETRRIRRDGTPFDASLAVAPLRAPDGRTTGSIAILADITERKLLEAQLLQAQKMESIGRLAGGVAHDFNNLLTAISGYSELLLLDAAMDDPRRADLEEIRSAASRAKALTGQLLAFSRRQIMTLEVLDLNEVVDGIAPLLRRLIGEDITLRAVTIADLGRVRADRGQLEQVIVNLAINARDAMPAGGSLTLETANVTLDDRHAAFHPDMTPGQYVVLAVTDSGVGMDEATRSHLFEPFFTTKEHGRGTGLGLATVYGIVRQSAGHIIVQSEPGFGSTFKVYFPRVEAPSEVVVDPQPQPASGGNETVLVVEDDMSVRALTTEILRRHGYTVLVASDTAEALMVIGNHPDPIELLVTDVIMPGLSGPELAEQLTRMRPGMRVLYVSGYADETIVHHGILEPGVAFLAKPFTPDAFARKVREVLATAA